MPELLLEIGCEEIPATSVKKAYQDLQAAIVQALIDTGLGSTGSTSLGTPRRLIVSVSGISPRQQDSVKEFRGPSLAAAYAPDGNPTKALEGFCKGQGVEPSQVRNDGEYVWVDKPVPGKSAAEVLAAEIPQALKSLSFDKSMRWADCKVRFVRPVRWILATLDGATVPFEFAGTASGDTSRGHRFTSPGDFQAQTLQGLLSGLAQRGVEPDPEKRRETVTSQATSAALTVQGTPDLDPKLVEENVFITEFPTAHLGSFDPKYLELPSQVLVTAMAKHERFFPVRDQHGQVTNHFVSVRNSGDENTVRAGNEWVLNARFNDARFFFDQDKAKTLEEFRQGTARMLFQEKLGTILERSTRLSGLAKEVALATGADQQEVEWAAQAGLYAKADLAAGLVSELASLQGVVGGIYAKREGFPEAVCQAIESQYLPANDSAATAKRLVIADQLDRLAGFLGIGLVPKGSSDPFALRRAATLLIETYWSWPTRVKGFKPLFQTALAQYQKSGVEISAEAATASLNDLLQTRYESLLDSDQHDVVQAALSASDLTDPQSVRFRVKACRLAAADPAIVQTLSRPVNILAAARKKHEPVPTQTDLAKADSPEGEALYRQVAEVADRFNTAVQSKDAQSALEILRALQKPINGFFDSTMVMAEDPNLRANRLALLLPLEKMVSELGDLTKIVIPG